MLNQISLVRKPESFSVASAMGLIVGLATILYVLLIGQSHNPTVRSVAVLIGEQGNVTFLWLTNLYLIIWAYRHGLKSIISLTLWLNFIIGVSVQGIKFLLLGIQMMGWAALPWTFRPSGAAGGFPSGHAAHAFAMAFVLTCFFPRGSWFWYACAAAISWARVEASAHTDLQVVVGTIWPLNRFGDDDPLVAEQ